MSKIEIKLMRSKMKYFWMPRDCLSHIFSRETLDTTRILSCPMFYAVASFLFVSQSAIEPQNEQRTNFIPLLKQSFL